MNSITKGTGIAKHNDILWLIERAYMEILQHTYYFQISTFGTQRMIQRFVSPTHPFRKSLIHDYFVRCTRRTPFLHRHPHHLKVVLKCITESGREERLSTLTFNH